MDNDFINDFIEEYKNQPCLWQASSADFKDRKKRQEAYYKLIEVASKHGEHYNIERTKQKINNLRCAFRHQLKKLTESKNNKTGKDEGYCPKRRYIESLMFLLNEEQPESAKIDNLKTTPVSKKKVNSISANCNDALTRTKKVIVKNDKQPQQMYCEAIVIPGDTTPSGTVTPMISDDSPKKIHTKHQHQQQKQSDIIVKSVERITTESTAKDVQQQQNPVHIEVHCDEDVNLLWQRSSITEQKSSNESPTSTPVTIGTVPVATMPIISATIPTPVSSIITTANTTLESNSYAARPRAMSTSSQNSSHSLTENVTKKVKVDCSATNFDKLLSLACSKINSVRDNDDDFSVFGKMVSYKLRSMDSQQAIIAEKMITDILLEGQMKLLRYPLRTTVSSFRQDDGQALVINLNGDNTSTDHHHHHSMHQQTDLSKYSHNIQYSTAGNGS